MDYFDGLINDTKALLEGFDKTAYPVSANPAWEDVGRNEIIMLREAAYELSGVGFNLVTSSDIGKSEILVYGRELGEIKENSPFARISLIQLEDISDEQKAYDLIRKTEYKKYHFHPKGYMMRCTSDSHRESVRISKTALREGLSFKKAGELLIKQYKESPAVKAVKVIFVTEKGAPYKELEAVSKKNYEITEALNHIMNNINFDCDSCKLKKICDEVEGMRELHFKKSRA